MIFSFVENRNKSPLRTTFLEKQECSAESMSNYF
jgi:hypothetical protein